MKIGITGNKFSGKSTVCKLFKDSYLTPVFEADVILKFIINNNKKVYELYKNKLAENFRKLSKNIKTDKTEVEIILDAAEPELFRAYANFNKKYGDTGYTIFSSSILFERGWHKFMDYNINVFTPRIYRMERIKAATDKTMIEISNSLLGEPDELDKNSLANFVIHNYNDYSLLSQIKDIDEHLIEICIRSEFGDYSNNLYY